MGALTDITPGVELGRHQRALGARRVDSKSDPGRAQNRDSDDRQEEWMHDEFATPFDDELYSLPGPSRFVTPRERPRYQMYVPKLCLGTP